ncbi:MAG: sigma-54 dependent transcriptional regulator [Pseudomonadota bacterium]
MLIRLVLAMKNKELQQYLEKKFADYDVQLKSCGQLRSPWQKLVRSCGDIFVVGESVIPKPIESGIAMLNSLPENPTTIILLDNESSEEHAQLVAAGADVVLYSGISSESLAEAIETTLESRRQLNLMDRFDRRGRIKPKILDFTSNSEEMQLFIDEVQQVIPSDSLLLILGETGAGKEHLAKAIHAESPRSAGPFITINTAALPEQLLESELFGHEQGAFTGAVRSRRGAFELAHGGTIFLDEIGEMPLHLQTKLLRILQDFEFTPLGGENPIWVDVRVIAATNRDLEKEISRGTFRQDLYYRLSVVTLTIPPLRNRREDIPAMTSHFINLYNNKIGRAIRGISKPALEAMCNYDWPGNIRELMNVIERAVLLCKSSEISIQNLPSTLHGEFASPRGMFHPDGDIPASWKNKTLPEVQEEMMAYVERRFLEMALRETQGRVGEAAKMAGIHPRGLYNKLRRMGIRKEAFKKAR